MNSVVKYLKLTTLVCAFGIFGGSLSIAKAGPDEPGLGAVRVVARPAVLSKIVAAAKSAGWMRTENDKPGSVKLFVPENYKPEDFARLLKAIQQVRSRNFGLQMIDKLGRVIGPEGQPMEVRP